MIFEIPNAPLQILLEELGDLLGESSVKESVGSGSRGGAGGSSGALGTSSAMNINANGGAAMKPKGGPKECSTMFVSVVGTGRVVLMLLH